MILVYDEDRSSETPGLPKTGEHVSAGTQEHESNISQISRTK